MSNITKELEDILKEYIDKVDETTDDVMKKASSDTAKDLRSTSPERTGRYAAGWTVKSEKGVRGMIYTVYNKKYYRLTHLLENGHVIRNKKGTYGRAPAHPHIKAAEDRAAQRIIPELESKL